MIGRQRTPRRWSRAIRHALGSVLAMLAACQAYAHNAGVSTSRIAIHGQREAEFLPLWSMPSRILRSEVDAALSPAR